MYMWTPTSEVSHVGSIDNDVELFSNLDAAQVVYPSPFNYNNTQGHFANPNNYFQQAQQPVYMPMVAPLVSPPTVDLSEAVARMNMEDHYGHRQRLSLSSNLSLNIQPCISITEPTPIHRMPALDQVDDFIGHHFSELSQQEQQQQQQKQQQQHDSFTQLMDPSFIDDLLVADTDQTDWLSWTPARGTSPISVNSNSFDDHNSTYSTSPEPSSFLDMLMLTNDVPTLGSSYPSPSFSEYNNTLSVKKVNRSRRVSEPPRPSNSIIQEQQQFNNTLSSDRSIRRSNSDRRSRSNSNASPLTIGSGSHPCLYPGCGKSFTRPYNLTSHMRK